MKNFMQPGKILTLTAPAGDVVSGSLYKIGSLVVVATHDAADGDPFEALVGPAVVQAAKPGSEPWSEGDPIYFDESEGLVTTDDDTAANALIGVAVEEVGGGAEETLGKVRLDGVAR